MYICTAAFLSEFLCSVNSNQLISYHIWFCFYVYNIRYTKEWKKRILKMKSDNNARVWDILLMRKHYSVTYGVMLIMRDMWTGMCIELTWSKAWPQFENRMYFLQELLNAFLFILFEYVIAVLVGLTNYYSISFHSIQWIKFIFMKMMMTMLVISDLLFFSFLIIWKAWN